jgi:hypothetical protein
VWERELERVREREREERERDWERERRREREREIRNCELAWDSKKKCREVWEKQTMFEGKRVGVGMSVRKGEREREKERAKQQGLSSPGAKFYTFFRYWNCYKMATAIFKTLYNRHKWKRSLLKSAPLLE